MSDIILQEPISVLNKAIQLDMKAFFLSSFKTLIGTGSQIAMGNPLAGATASKGMLDIAKSANLETKTEELAWILVVKSVMEAVNKTLYDFRDLFTVNITEEQLSSINEELVTAINSVEVVLESDFFDKVKELEFVRDFRPIFLNWLQELSLNEQQAESFYNQFKSNLVFAFHKEASDNSTYAPIFDKLDSKFLQATNAEKQLAQYRLWLEQEVNKRMFEESFGLRQVYISLRAYYQVAEPTSNHDTTDTTLQSEIADNNEIANKHRMQSAETHNMVCAIHDEIKSWLDTPNEQDTLRIINGGPGSGKSSFAKMLAYELAKQVRPVLFIPLHRLKLERYLLSAIKEYIQISKNDTHLTEAILEEENLLIIFDGLDELTMQAGGGVQETAKNFIDEVKSMLRDYRSKHWKALVTGREIAIQSQKHQFKQDNMLFYLLPYYLTEQEQKRYVDKDDLLVQDQRQDWWQNFAKRKGIDEQGLPKVLSTEHLQPITKEPLLNYLLSLSYLNDNIVFDETTNLNQIYADLLSSVHERKYASSGRLKVVDDIEKNDFERILQEIALAVWHNNGRTATLKQISTQCEQANLTTDFDVFKTGAESGVIKLLMAFYFREFGGQGDKTFEFTHKSFGEYLTARRIMRELEDIYDDYLHDSRKRGKPTALENAFINWLKLFGKQYLDEDIQEFITGEMALIDNSTLENYQRLLVELLQMAIDEKSPIKTLGLASFAEDLSYSRNAERALLIMHSKCAKKTKKVIKDLGLKGNINLWSNKLDAWGFPFHNLRFIENTYFSSRFVFRDDFSYSIFESSTSKGVGFHFSNLNNVLFRGTKFQPNTAHFSFSRLRGISFESTQLISSNFKSSRLDETNFLDVKLKKVNSCNTTIVNSNFKQVDFIETDFRDSMLKNCNFDNVRFLQTDCRDLTMIGCHFEQVDFIETDFRDSMLKNCNFDNVKFLQTDCRDLTMIGCKFKKVDFVKVDLRGIIILNCNFDEVTFEDAIVTGTPLAELAEAVTDDKGEVRLTKVFPAKEVEENEEPL